MSCCSSRPLATGACTQARTSPPRRTRPCSPLTDGTVQEVLEDGLYGTCVTLSHDADLTSTYRGLTDVRVVAGQAVTAGEALGAVAEDH